MSGVTAAELPGRWIYGRFGYAQVISARLEDGAVFVIAKSGAGGPVPLPVVFGCDPSILILSESADSEREAMSRAAELGWDGKFYRSYQRGAPVDARKAPKRRGERAR